MNCLLDKLSGYLHGSCKVSILSYAANKPIPLRVRRPGYIDEGDVENRVSVQKLRKVRQIDDGKIIVQPSLKCTGPRSTPPGEEKALWILVPARVITGSKDNLSFMGPRDTLHGERESQVHFSSC